MPIPHIPFTDYELFNTINLIIPAYLLLAIAPKTKLTKIVCSLEVGYFSLMYIGLIVNAIMTSEEKSDFTTLDGVIKMFKNPEAVMAGWIHYVAFDFFTSWFIATDAAEH